MLMLMLMPQRVVYVFLVLRLEAFQGRTRFSRFGSCFVYIRREIIELLRGHGLRLAMQLTHGPAVT
jgi:hypothetical protein